MALDIQPKEIEKFKDETLAVEAFRAFKHAQGIGCKKCGCQEYYWLAAKKQCQCVKCKFRTTLRSGTFLECSKLPISYLYVILHGFVVTQGKLGVEDLKNLTGHKYFDPIYDLYSRLKQYTKGKTDEEAIEMFYDILSYHPSSRMYNHNQ